MNMEKFARFFFSMGMMTIGLFLFLFAIGWATFIEAAYDTQTAKIMVYNALWFEVLLAYLCINLIANIFTYRMFQREKIATLMFHLAFIVMIIGAGVTRFFGFEGMMLIREGSTSDFIYSSEPYFWFAASDGKVKSEPVAHKMYLSEATDNYFKFEINDFPGRKQPITIEFVNFQKKLIDSLVVNDSISESSLEIVTNGRRSNYVSEGGFLMLGDNALSFDKPDAMPGIHITRKGAQLFLRTVLPVRSIGMSALRQADQVNGPADSLYNNIPIDTLVPFEAGTLYMVGAEQFVFKGMIRHSRMMRLPSGRDDMGEDCLTIRVSDGEHTRLVDLNGGYGAIPEHVVFRLNGVDYQMEYGSMKIQLPFQVRCNDFQLDKYPGSMAPSSFASEVTIIDTEKGVTRDKRIFMNHVLDYRGYRLFQSGYDPDEGGTRLSVNHDWYGTLISYIGYLMMGIGMLLAFFSPNGRFRELLRKIGKSAGTAAAGLFVLFSASWAHAQHEGHDHGAPGNFVYRVMSEEHSDKLAYLLVQNNGRIYPYHTLCDQMMRKLRRDNTYEDLNAVQAVTSMHMYQGHWLREPVIYVSPKSDLREKLGMKDAYISYLDLTDTVTGEFKLMADYQKAHQKFESKRNEYDKRLLQLGERYQLMGIIFRWDYMNLVPAGDTVSHRWYSPLNNELQTLDSTGQRLAFEYFNALDKAAESGRFGKADDALQELMAYQRKKGGEIVPSESRVNVEVWYNKREIVKSVMNLFSIAGLLLFVLYFVRVLRNADKAVPKWIKKTTWGLSFIAIAGFLYLGLAVYLRSVITGEAPWSNGYEAMVFISFVVVLVALIFSRRHGVILAAGLILAWLMLFVSEMNLMDPEITPLQPVLKSYWLMIHVAIITGSYAPLGLSFMLGIVNLILYIVRTKNNGTELTRQINTLTYLSEVTMMIGTVMLTIGTFLGGVWANESWGRYWGWDPKETWALVAILAYAIVLHFRFIPKLKGKFSFNLASVWAYATILFTFFGVNFYLVGLHSYAQGEGLNRLPGYVIVMIVAFVLFSMVAWWRQHAYKKSVQNNQIDE